MNILMVKKKGLIAFIYLFSHFLFIFYFCLNTWKRLSPELNLRTVHVACKAMSIAPQ